MRLHTPLLLLGLTTTALGQTELRDDAAQRARAAGETVRQHLLEGDMAAVIDQIPDELFPGGAANKERAKQLPQPNADVTELAKNMKWGPASPIRSVAGWHVTVLHYTSSIRKRGISSSQIAFSKDGGATWGLLSGSRTAVAGLRRIAPEVHAAIEEDLEPTKLIRQPPKRTPTLATWDELYGAPELATEPGTATLAFAWPDALRLRVKRTATWMLEGPDATKSNTTVLEYDLVGAKTEAGYTISVENLKETVPFATPATDALTTLAEALELLGDWPADLILTDPASPPALTDVERAVRESRARFGAASELPSDAGERAMVELNCSAEAVTNRAIDGWGKMVGAWHGNTVELGAPLTFEADTTAVRARLSSEFVYSVHSSPLLTGGDDQPALYRLYIEQRPKQVTEETASPSPAVAAVAPHLQNTVIRSWVDATEDLVPVRYVRTRVLSVPIPGAKPTGTKPTDKGARVGTRWDYEFTRIE